jgi:hypothetical protein
VSKKLIIIAAAAGLVSFAGMFALGLITKKNLQAQAPQAEQATPVRQQAGLNLAQPKVQAAGSDAATDDKMKIAMTEKQLRELIYEVRDKIKDYDSKSQELTAREQKLQAAQETLKKDIEELDNLRIELASTVASIKSEEDKLSKSRIEVANAEKTNLVSIAATYDKMDSSQAGKILSNMSQAKSGNPDDAVKILYYMSDRTKAKVLASIAETEPAVSAKFCQKLKQITEKD